MARIRTMKIRKESPSSKLLKDVAELAQPLRSAVNLDPLLERIGNAHFVLLGEASHGTSEFYSWRRRISQRLIEERRFSFIAVEADWPDCYRVNQYIQGQSETGISAREILSTFHRWPTWMWANEEVIELVEWLREYNDHLPAGQNKVAFYGLDVYSLWDSLYSILAYLRREQPELLPAARLAFQCFEPYGEDVQAYAAATRWTNASCEKHVIDLLTKLRTSALGKHAEEGQFSAEQNAAVVKNAELYYRTMVRGGPDSWNARDTHMTETLSRLMVHYGPTAKAILWEHNTHIGDARFTDMAGDGMVNVGQLVREQHGENDTVLVGFSSYRGSVIAAGEWETAMERMPLPPAISGSWDDVLHRVNAEDQLLIFESGNQAPDLAEPRGQRAVGVVYHPEREYGNYVPTILPRRYDALIHCDETNALRPLHHVPVFEEGEPPETYPTGL
ncbi:MAG: protein-L-isoaspartate O-methyltransferase [Planctomycetaceae bacterium]|nr:protein-L-isoaspartate O-methyltransferase [Planctomycetaceae bacterium]